MMNRDYGRVLWGVVIIAMGVLLLAGERGEWDFSRAVGQFWPFILIALGAVRLAQPPHRSGAFLLFIGLWALATQMRVAGLNCENSWPIVVVGVGVSIVWRALRGDPICDRHPARRNHVA